MKNLNYNGTVKNLIDNLRLVQEVYGDDVQVVLDRGSWIVASEYRRETNELYLETD
jgi:hypothetical protein